MLPHLPSPFAPSRQYLDAVYPDHPLMPTDRKALGLVSCRLPRRLPPNNCKFALHSMRLSDLHISASRPLQQISTTPPLFQP